MNIEQQIAQSIENGHKWIEMYALSIQSHTRIIDKKLKIKNISGHLEIDNQRWDERKGWSKPDRENNIVEHRYLWKQFKPYI